MRFLTSILVFATTITALPITDTNTPATAEITTPNIANAVDNNTGKGNVAATADANDGPNWNYGPPNGPNGGYNYNNGPGYGAGYGPPAGPPPRLHEPERSGGALESIGYGLGSVIGTPVGWLGDLVGGAGSGLYNGLKGGYKMIKG